MSVIGERRNAMRPPVSVREAGAVAPRAAAAARKFPRPTCVDLAQLLEFET